jgi:hypothetical protein
MHTGCFLQPGESRNACNMAQQKVTITGVVLLSSLPSRLSMTANHKVCQIIDSLSATIRLNGARLAPFKWQ